LFVMVVVVVVVGHAGVDASGAAILPIELIRLRGRVENGRVGMASWSRTRFVPMKVPVTLSVTSYVPYHRPNMPAPTGRSAGAMNAMPESGDQAGPKVPVRNLSRRWAVR